MVLYKLNHQLNFRATRLSEATALCSHCPWLGESLDSPFKVTNCCWTYLPWLPKMSPDRGKIRSHLSVPAACRTITPTILSWRVLPCSPYKHTKWRVMGRAYPIGIRRNVKIICHRITGLAQENMKHQQLWEEHIQLPLLQKHLCNDLV